MAHRTSPTGPTWSHTQRLRPSMRAPVPKSLLLHSPDSPRGFLFATQLLFGAEGAESPLAQEGSERSQSLFQERKALSCFGRGVEEGAAKHLHSFLFYPRLGCWEPKTTQEASSTGQELEAPLPENVKMSLLCSRTFAGNLSTQSAQLGVWRRASVTGLPVGPAMLPNLAPCVLGLWGLGKPVISRLLSSSQSTLGQQISCSRWGLQRRKPRCRKRRNELRELLRLH